MSDSCIASLCADCMAHGACIHWIQECSCCIALAPPSTPTKQHATAQYQTYASTMQRCMCVHVQAGRGGCICDTANLCAVGRHRQQHMQTIATPQGTGLGPAPPPPFQPPGGGGGGREGGGLGFTVPYCDRHHMYRQLWLHSFTWHRGCKKPT